MVATYEQNGLRAEKQTNIELYKRLDKTSNRIDQIQFRRLILDNMRIFRDEAVKTFQKVPKNHFFDLFVWKFGQNVSL